MDAGCQENVPPENSTPLAPPRKLHDVDPTRDTGHRHPASHDLGKGRRVRLNVEKAGGASRAKPEPRDYFIEDQECSMPPRQLPRHLQEPPGSRQATTGSHDWLEYEAGHALSVLPELGLQHRNAAEPGDDNLVAHRAGKAPALRVEIHAPSPHG